MIYSVDISPTICFSVRNVFNLFLNIETDIVVSSIFNICLATFHITLVRYSKESLGWGVLM